jgi:hypothetical protein
MQSELEVRQNLYMNENRLFNFRRDLTSFKAGTDTEYYQTRDRLTQQVTQFLSIILILAVCWLLWILSSCHLPDDKVKRIQVVSREEGKI